MFGDGRQRLGVILLSVALLGSFLAVDPWGWDAFGPLRFLVIPSAALLGCAAVFIGEPDTLRLPSRPVFALAVGFVGWIGVTTFTGVDRWHAFVGTPDRHFGWLTWIVLAVVVLAVGQLTERSIDLLLLAIVVATALVGVYSILELFDIGVVDRTFADDRIGGPFGQPAYLGAAMALAVPLCIGWTIDRSDVPGRVVGVAASLGGIVALLASQSRAAWVGVALAAAVTLVRNRRRIAGAPLRGIAAVTALVVVAAAATAALTPLGDRALSLTQLDGIADSRSDEWAVASRALAANPILGTGPEGYRIVFGKHVDEAYAIEHGRTVITDRAHNSLLDVGVTTGVPGLLAYGAILAAIVAGAISAVAADRARTAGLAAGVIAYITAALFLFPVAEIEVVAATCAASIAVLSGRWREVDVPRLGRGVVVLGALGLAAAGLVAVVVGALDVAADHRVAAAIEHLDDPNAGPGTALAAADDARGLRPDSTRYDFIAARIAAQTTTPADAQVRLEKGLQRSPDDPAFLNEQADLAVTQARSTRQPSDMQRATSLATQRTVKDPNNGSHHLRLGLIHALTGEQEAALADFARAATLNARDGEPLFNQAVVLVELGRFDDARAAAQTAAVRDASAAPAVARLLGDIDQLEVRIAASEQLASE